MQNIYSYLHFPERIDDQINNLQDGLKIVKDILMSVYLVDCDISSILYYCKSNKDTFFGNINAFEQLNTLNIGVYDFETAINSLIFENNIFSVEEQNTSGCSIKYYNTNILNLDENVPIVLYNAVERHGSLKENDKQIVLNLFGDIFPQNPILIIIDCGDKAETIEVPFITNFTELDGWLKENRLARNFNDTDTRHIEHSGNHRKDRNTNEYKSPLLGGIGGRANAKELLKNAVGDKRSESNKKDLVNYDESKGEYIWYEYENANNQYHAYHLVKAFEHARDGKAVERISKRVLKILEYREELKEV